MDDIKLIPHEPSSFDKDLEWMNKRVLLAMAAPEELLMRKPLNTMSKTEQEKASAIIMKYQARIMREVKEKSFLIGVYQKAAKYPKAAKRLRIRNKWKNQFKKRMAKARISWEMSAQESLDETFQSIGRNQ